MKRWILRILIFLVLGAVINVAVAVWCHLRPPALPHERQLSPDRAARLLADRVGPSTGESIISGAGFEARVLWRLANSRTVVESSDPHFLYLGYRAGIPLRSLKGEMWIGSEGPWVTVNLIRNPAKPPLMSHRVLPVGLIWPGFVVNTVFYASIFWLAFRGPPVLRRHLRRKRGRCIRCGYDLRGEYAAGCPECGWNREEAKP